MNRSLTMYTIFCAFKYLDDDDDHSQSIGATSLIEYVVFNLEQLRDNIIMTDNARQPGTSQLNSSPWAKEMEKKLELIEEMTTNVDAVQERVLAEILGRNADAEYLATNCCLSGATDRAAFRAKVPMATYEDLKPYIRRIADGDRSPVLTGSGHPVSEFLVSSGTSGGEPKLFPTVKDDLGRRLLLQSLVMPVMNKHVSGLDEGSGLYFHFVKTETKTPGGLLPVRTVLTSLWKSNHFKNDPSRRGYTSPVAAVLCEDVFQSTYVQMLCGLCHRHSVRRVGAVFAYGLLRAIHFLQLNWEQLAADIDAGELTPRVTDVSVREAVASVLTRPDPDLARFLRAECSDSCWAGIVTRIWPNAKCLDAIATGSMTQYVPALRYYGGCGLPIISMVYASSECSLGINLRPVCDPSEVSYTIMPNMAYFEFLPVDAQVVEENTTASQQQLVELADVEVGSEYELVVTTYGGLCRCLVGDVLRVTGFHNAAPEFRFVRRKNVLLSVDFEKTDEAALQRAVERASLLLRRWHGHGVLDYTSRACNETIPGHYVIYWELLATGSANNGGVESDVLERCCMEMEDALGSVYLEARVAVGSIGPLEMRVVAPGTFEELADHAVVSRGASIGQYKVPRCVTVPAMIHLLDSRVVSSHFSPSLPNWAPDQRLGSAAHKCSSPSSA